MCGRYALGALPTCGCHPRGRDTMKFRAKLLDVTCISRFSGVVSTLAHNVKTCVLRLSREKICFVVAERGALGMNMWCELPQGNFFDEYRIEGRDENHEIYLELNLEQLSRALRSASNAQLVKIKLTKKTGAFLTLEVAQPTAAGVTRDIVHNVPVSVVPQRLWSDFQEPDMPDIDVSVYLPPLRQLKGIVDRMKSLSNYVTVAANMRGTLQLQLATNAVTVTTMFRDLQNHQFDSQTSSDSQFLYEARVDIRKLSHLLGSQLIPIKAICNIVQHRGLQVFQLHDDVSMQYYLPAMAS